MYRGHVDYIQPVTTADLEVFNNKIREENESENPDTLKIAKLYQAKMLCGLFNNEFSNKGRNMLPW